MSADLYARAQAAIAERRALIEAGTPGPWHPYHGPGGYPNEVRTHPDRDKGLPVLFDGNGVTLGSAHYMRGFDADLIVAAVNAFARDTDTLVEVLERHALGVHPDGLCEHCDRTGHLVEWPCTDARSALAALGVEA